MSDCSSHSLLFMYVLHLAMQQHAPAFELRSRTAVQHNQQISRVGALQNPRALQLASQRLCQPIV